jgi:hypothetical protein
MEMEQRVGRVHRFGSRQTILVDTLVVRASRETDAWRVARERLDAIAHTLVAPDRFETVFSRVMCLIPPEELQTVLISSPASPLGDAEVQRLTSLVDSGFSDWMEFHNRYAANQRNIRNQPAGLARWAHLRSFLLRHGDAEVVPGITRTRFVQSNEDVQAVQDDAEVLRLGDGSLRFVGDFEGGLFDGDTGSQVLPLGLNVPPVADLLRKHVRSQLPTGAAHLRWGENQRELRSHWGEDLVVLAFIRQSFHLDSVGGVTEVGSELMAFSVRMDETAVLSPEHRAALFGIADLATVRVRPVDTPLHVRAVQEEARLIQELRRPSETALREGIRYAVWPILALHLSP